MRRGSWILDGIGELAVRPDRGRVDGDLRAPLGQLDLDAAADLDERRGTLRVPRLEDLDDTREAVRDVGAGDAARVERPHRQLRARLADRLRGDDADRIADLAHLAGGEEHAVAGLAHAGLGAALEHRPHRDGALLPELGLELLEERIGHDRAEVGQLGLPGLAARERLVDRMRDHAAEQRLVQPLARANRQLDVLLGAAVVLADDHVLRDVDEAPGEVPRVGRAERGVGEALAGAVGRDEVLEHRQALHEVGLDRALDDLALRIRHQAAHAGELADLLERSAGAGVGHHEHRVQLVEVVLHRVGDLVRRIRPDVDDRLAALVLGDQTAVVLAVDVLDLLLVLGKDLLLVRRDDDVVLRDRHAGLRRVAEPERLDRVEHRRERVRPVPVAKREHEAVGVRLRQGLVREDEVLDVPVLVADQLAQLSVDGLLKSTRPGVVR